MAGLGWVRWQEKGRSPWCAQGLSPGTATAPGGGLDPWLGSGGTADSGNKNQEGRELGLATEFLGIFNIQALKG